MSNKNIPKNIPRCIDGIHELEQIAKEDEERYYWRVMQALTSYVREESPYNPEISHQESEEKLPPLRNDLQAVMTVLARRRYTYGHRLEPHPLDLSRTDLHRLKLPPNASLSEILLVEANLQGAELFEVNLQGANLRDASLQRANLGKANLEKAKLMRVNLRGARLDNANLKEAALNNAILIQVSLNFADLQKATLGGAILQNSTLYQADLTESDLTLAILREAGLIGANLQEANPTQADLWHARLDNANLQGTILKFAWLQEVFGLLPHQVGQAVCWEEATISAYLRQQLQASQVEESQTPNQATENFQSPRGEIEISQQKEMQLSQEES